MRTSQKRFRPPGIPIRERTNSTESMRNPKTSEIPIIAENAARITRVLPVCTLNMAEQEKHQEKIQVQNPEALHTPVEDRHKIIEGLICLAVAQKWDPRPRETSPAVWYSGLGRTEKQTRTKKRQAQKPDLPSTQTEI